MDDLARLRRATANRERADEAWKNAIRAAHANGASLRRVGEAAGITHVRVLQILRASQ